MNAAADLQTVIRQFLPGYREQHSLSPREAEVCHHILSCRSEALGGVQLHCDQCEYEQPWYCACGDRHCPKCQWRATEAWSEKQYAVVLPVTYYHLVITLPHELNGWVELHPEVIYRLFFQVMWATLKAFAADPRRLGGQLGVTAILHTWGQQLWRHVHLHCLIPGGALGEDNQWHCAYSSYLFPDRALARHVRGRMVSELRQAWQRGELHRITRSGEVDELLDQLMGKDWVVYTKPWLRRPETVVDYLARYTHRTAISDARIGEIVDGEVAVAYKDYQDNDRWKTMHLAGEELIRRFLLHVLPKGLMRIRHYGFLANRCRREKLAKIREILGRAVAKTVAETGEAEEQASLWPCPKCHRGHLRVSHTLAPVRLSGA
jgi:hypothetical protein